jgi:hypothetical protein
MSGLARRSIDRLVARSDLPVGQVSSAERWFG